MQDYISKYEKIFQGSMNKQKKLLQESKKKSPKIVKYSYQTTKKISKILFSTTKGIIGGIKSLIGLLIAGGIMSVVVILIICLVGLLTTSVFGLFFSSEDIGNNGIKISDCISEINLELNNKIKQLEGSDTYNEVIINFENMNWKSVLTIYAALVTNGHDNTSLIIMTNERKEVLKKVFWDMNIISTSVDNSNNKKILELM